VVKLYMLIRSVKLNSTLKIVLSENSLVLSHFSPFGDDVINVLLKAYAWISSKLVSPLCLFLIGIRFHY